MLNYGEAKTRIIQQAERTRLPPQSVALDSSLGRIAASDILSPRTVPPFDNSSMDGFALRSEWTLGASSSKPIRLAVKGSVSAGDLPPQNDATPGAWEIMTGAPFPEGLDASVRVEDVVVTRDSRGYPVSIEISSPAELNQYRRGAGEDFSIGTPVLAAGTWIAPEHLLALSSLGIRELSVLRRPRVAVLSTGKELAPLEAELGPGQIRNSTAHFLRAAVPLLGAEYIDCGAIQDEPTELERVLKSVLDRPQGPPDVIVTTGAVSMGKHDFVAPTLQKMGAETLFHKVAIRPGKPLLFSTFQQGTALFGLPGNPVSTVVGLRFFVEPYLRALQGLPPEAPWRARLTHSVGKPSGLRCFFKARYATQSDRASVQILPGQMSFLVRPLLQANAWAVLPEENDTAAEGTEVDVYPPYSTLYSPSYGWGQNADYDGVGSRLKHSADQPHHPTGCCK